MVAEAGQGPAPNVVRNYPLLWPARLGRRRPAGAIAVRP